MNARSHISLVVSIVFMLACLLPVCASAQEPVDSVVDVGIAIRMDHPSEADSVTNVVTAPGVSPDGKVRFNPDPTRAVWLSALFPGLGQIYNRRYWKLPIIAGGYIGLGYATAWNNNQYSDYTRAYNDLTDNDPSTTSYMNFFPPTTTEDQLDKSWLTQTMKSRKDYFRRNRDLCIIGMVGLYLLCIVDAYVDASLSHFDISDNLSLDIQPALLPTQDNRHPAMGASWALNF